MTNVVPIHPHVVTGPKYTGQELYEAWEGTRPDPDTHMPIAWDIIKPKHRRRWEKLADQVNERVNSQPYEIKQLISEFMSGIDERLSRSSDTIRSFIDPRYIPKPEEGSAPPPRRTDDDIVQAANDFLLINKRSEQLETYEMIDELRKRGYDVSPPASSACEELPAKDSETKHVVTPTGKTTGGRIDLTGKTEPTSTLDDLKAQLWAYEADPARLLTPSDTEDPRFVSEDDFVEAHTTISVDGKRYQVQGDPYKQTLFLEGNQLYSVDDQGNRTKVNELPNTLLDNKVTNDQPNTGKTSGDEQAKEPGPFDVIVDGIIRLAKDSLLNALDRTNRADVSQYYLEMANAALGVLKEELKKKK